MAQFEQYISSLPKYKTEAIRRIVEQKALQGEIRTQEAFNRSLSEAISEVDRNNQPITSRPSVSPYTRTDADIYNNFMESVLADLTALYKESNFSDYLIGLEESNNKDFQDTVLSSVKTLRGELTAHKSLISDADGYTSVFYESFDDPGSRILDGVVMEDGNLKVLPFTTEMQAFEIQSVEIIRYPGYNVQYLKTDEFDPEINPSIIKPGAGRGYWAEVALSDEIPSFTLEDESDIPQQRTFQGILAIARITFTTPISMNALMLDPYCAYPIGIPWLRYRSTIGSPWQHITSNGYRLSKRDSSSRIYFLNLDRVTIKTLEVPIHQPNGETSNYTLGESTVEEQNLLRNVIHQDLRELEEEVLKYTATKSSNTSYKRVMTKLLKQENVHDSIKEIFDLLGIGRRTTTVSSRGIVGIDGICQNCEDQPAVESPLKYTFAYGLFGIYPMSIKYARGGTYVSPNFNGIRKQITSAALDATLDIPDLTTVGFFLELEGGRRYTLLPRGTTRVREYIPVVPDKTGFPKAYYSNEHGTDEFIIGNPLVYSEQTGSGELLEVGSGVLEPISGESVSGLLTEFDLSEVNRIWPSFYIDAFNSEDVKLYRNGERIPHSVLQYDETYRMINIPVSGELPLYSPLSVHDDIVLEYTLDSSYGPPGGRLETIPDTTQSGDFYMVISPEYQIDFSKDNKLYITTPRTQWMEVDQDEFYITSDVVIISSQYISNYITDDTTGLQMFFQYYSYNEDFNGPVGRRDSSGLPDRLDVIEAHSRIITSETPTFSIVANTYKSSFKIENYRIILPHSPVIDYNLYNYDGTWNTDPQTLATYHPIKVEIGASPNKILALDRTKYKSEEIPILSPFEEFGFYEFYLKDNILYFNIETTTLDVTITYEYIASYANLVIEERTNRLGVSDYTPVVKDLNLRLGLL